MKVKRVFSVYFSPTGATRRIAQLLSSQIAETFGVSCEEVNFTLPGARETIYRFEEDDLAVFAVPTYAGKLPNKLLPFIKSGFAGGGALAAAVVTFGNRSYDNALAELAQSLTENGFRLIGGGAFVTRHCFSGIIAADRPDAADLEELRRFGEAVCGKAGELPEREDDGTPAMPLLTVPGDPDAPYYRPKGRDGEPVNILKVKPLTDKALCDHCMKCAALCPMGSIDSGDPSLISGICIKCQACVRLCPKGAKYFDDPQFLSHKEMLEKSFTERKEPEWFV